MTSHDCCQSRANIGMFFDFFARVPCVTCQCSPYQRSPFDLIELLEKEVLKSKVAVEGISVILTFQANTCRVFLEGIKKPQGKIHWRLELIRWHYYL